MALVRSYAFDEGTGTTAAEASGGTSLTGVPGWAAGLHDDGLRLNLVNGPTVGGFTSTAFTVMFDVYLHTAAGNNGFQILTNGPLGDIGNVQQQSGGSVQWYPSLGPTGTSIPTGAWTHVAIVADDNDRRILIDGVVAGSGTSTTSVTSVGPWNLGSFSSYEPNVTIDNLRIYDHAVTDAEIAALAGTQVGGGGGGTTPVTATRSTSWDVRTAVTRTRSTTWRTRAAVTATRAATWRTRAAVSATRTTSWDTRRSVTAARATIWDTRGVVSATRATSWDTAASISRALATSWDVRTQVTAQRSTSWNVDSTMVAVTAQRATTWRTLARPTSTRATSWDTRAVVANARATSWDVRTATTRTSSTAWRILAPTAATRAASWRTLAPITATRATSWRVESELPEPAPPRLRVGAPRPARYAAAPGARPTITTTGARAPRYRTGAPS